MFSCPSCGAAVTDSGRRLIGPDCWLCGAPLIPADQAPAPDYVSAALWIPSLIESTHRANLRAESEV